MKDSQNKRVLQYMKQFGSITSMEAILELGITRLSARISDLKDSGVPIVSRLESRRRKDGSYTRYSVYSLGGDSDK